MPHSHSLSTMNSVAEAFETAIKAAGKWEYRIKETPDDMAARG
jgi:acetylornithine/succinyldiaminopimelate/putrescine aminotransferase